MNVEPQVTPQCIGVFDSGVGGLTVLRELRRQLPGTALRYVADAAYAPYGERSPAFIAERSLAIAEHLVGLGARLLVVACNTATAHAIAALRERWPGMPIVGTEPGIKPAVALSRNGRIGVMATPATLLSERFSALLSRHGQGTRVFAQPCPGLADLIEAGDLEAPTLKTLLAELCAPLRDAGVDTVLMGCTHYPLVQQILQAEFGPDVRLLNIETAVAQQAARLWTALKPAPVSSVPAAISLASTGDAQALTDFVRRAIGWRDLQAVSLRDRDDRGPTARTETAAAAG